MRPANVALRLPDLLEPDVETMTAHPDRPEELAARLWDLAAWSARANDLLEQLDRLTPDRPDALAPGFELSASVLRHLQSDPLLPPDLLPAQWPGATLRSAYDAWEACATGTRCRSGARLAERTVTVASVLAGAAERPPRGPSSERAVARPGKSQESLANDCSAT